MPTDVHTPWPVRVAALVAAGLLVVLWGAYWLTREPAPAINVRWREGTTAMQRAELERQYLLVRPAAGHERTFTYDLLDTSRPNLAAILHEPGIEDTDGIDRKTFTIPFDVRYGGSWIWIRYRIPLLRQPGGVEAIAGACALVLAACLGAWLEGWRLRRALRT